MARHRRRCEIRGRATTQAVAVPAADLAPTVPAWRRVPVPMRV
jgi:hypothetical protein